MPKYNSRRGGKTSAIGGSRFQSETETIKEKANHDPKSPVRTRSASRKRNAESVERDLDSPINNRKRSKTAPVALQQVNPVEKSSLTQELDQIDDESNNPDHI